MIFGDIPVAECAGAILAHSQRLPKGIFKKGRVLTEADARALEEVGIRTVVAARLEADDLGENEAAKLLAASVAGNGVSASPAFTGRVNLFAEAAGLAVIDRAAIDRLNLVDETVTLAALEPNAVAEPKQMVATLKIIPFGVPRPVVERCLAVARETGAMVRVVPFKAKRVALIQTRLPGLK